MSLVAAGTIEIPDSVATAFDHGAFEPESRRVFIAHTARDCLEVVDADTNQHLATLRGFPEAAGVVAGGGSVLVTNRGAASLSWVDAGSLETQVVLNTGPRPNGVAFVPSLQAAIVACIGDDTNKAQLQVLGLLQLDGDLQIARAFPVWLRFETVNGLNAPAPHLSAGPTPVQTDHSARLPSDPSGMRARSPGGPRATDRRRA